MKTIFLCYEMDTKTGLNYVKKVSAYIDFAKDFIDHNIGANRVEEWIIDGHKEGNGLINEFYSIEDFEERK